MMIALKLKEMVLFYLLCIFSAPQADLHIQVIHHRRQLQALIL